MASLPFKDHEDEWVKKLKEEYSVVASASPYHLTHHARSGSPSLRSASLERMVDSITGHHLDDGFDLPSPSG